MIDLVLHVETGNRGRWRVAADDGDRELVDPLTDEDLRRAAEAASPRGGASPLPECARTWDDFLAHFGHGRSWTPNARLLELVGRLIHRHLIRGRVAEHVRAIEARARAERTTLRYVVQIFEGEEDGLLPQLPYELLNDSSFWFRRPGTVGVRLAPRNADEVRLHPGARVLVATAHCDGQAPSSAQLAEHAAKVCDAVVRAGFVPRPIADCTPTLLEEALREGCDLLYLACHGAEDLDNHGRLFLRGGEVTGRELGRWLEAAVEGSGRRVQAVLLCACSSAVPGDRPGTMGMAAHVASSDRRAVAALGFRAPIDIAWGMAFMTQIFEQLACGASLEESVARARQAQAEDDPAWSLPLLFAPRREQRFGAAEVIPGEPRIRDAAPPLRSLLPVAPRAYFTAREKQLEQLRVWRTAPGAAVLTAVAGEGGVGKTEIARKIAHEASEAGTPVIWIERAHRDLGGSLAAMIRLAAPDYRPPDTATIDDLRARMVRELAPHRGLLVLDDLDQAYAAANLTPGPAWNVLVTTRARSLLPGVVEVEVEPLDPDDAVELLRKVAQAGAAFSTQEEPVARALVIELSCLPLAIEIVGELVRRGASLDEVREAARSDTGVADDGLLGELARVAARSLADLPPGDETAWALVAALPTPGATEEDVAVGLDEAEGRAGRRLFRLRQANLLRVHPASGRYTMHPLARQIAVTRARASASWDATRAASARVIHAAAVWCVEPFGRSSRTAYRRWSDRRSLFDALDLASWQRGTAGADDIAAALGMVDHFRAFERVPDERATMLDCAVGLASTCNTLANLHLARGDLRRFRADLEGAEADYALALTLFTEVQNNGGLAQVHHARGELRRRRVDLQGAEADYALALMLFTEVQDNGGLANVHHARGELRQFRADLEGADSDYARALALFTEVQDSLGLANVHQVRGDLRLRRADLEGADADYACALALYTDLRDNLGLANVHKVRGDLRRRRSDLEGAEADYARALALFTKVQDNLGLANVHRARGDLRRFRVDLAGAEEDFARALVLFSASHSNLGLANGHQARGDLRLRRDDLEGASADYEVALVLFTEVQDNLGLANGHKARGDLRLRRDDLEGAEADYEVALALFIKIQDNLGLANVHKARGDLRRHRNDLEGAEADYEVALALFTEVQEDVGLANVHQARGDLRRRRADLGGAEAEFALALTLYNKAQDNLGRANVDKARGDLHAGVGALDLAEDRYLEALRLYEESKDTLGISNVLAELAQTCARRGDRGGALRYALRAEPLAQAAANRSAAQVVSHVLAWAEDR